MGVAVELGRVTLQCEGDGIEALLLRLIAQHERVERGDSHAPPIDGVDAADGVAERQSAGWEDTQPAHSGRGQRPAPREPAALGVAECQWVAQRFRVVHDLGDVAAGEGFGE